MLFPLTPGEQEIVLNRIKMFSFLSLILGCIKTRSIWSQRFNGILPVFFDVYTFNAEMSEKNLRLTFPTVLLVALFMAYHEKN